MQGTAQERRPTLGRLWRRYLEVREQLVECGGEGELSEVGRKARRLCERLVVNYSPLVKYVAGILPSRLRAAADQEDIMSWGLMGLLHAIESYDPLRQTRFETYAISRIKWSILDELRKQDWVPRRVRTQAQEIERAAASLAQTLGRTPTEEEVSTAVGMEPEEYRTFVERYSQAQMSSLEARLEMNDRLGTEFHSFVTDRAAKDPQTEADEASVGEQLIEAIGELEERERTVATLYFYEGLTLKEIGKALNLSEGRISQILHRSLTKLRKSLTGSFILASA